MNKIIETRIEGEKPYTDNITRQGNMNKMLSVLAMFTAGVIHLSIVPEHWSHAPGHGLLFLTLGIVQIAWAGVFWKIPSIKFANIGIYIAGTSVVLWFITRFVTAPFGHGPEPLKMTGVVTKMIEMIVIFGLICPSQKETFAPKPVQAILWSVLIGFIVYAGGLLSEPILPWLKAPAHKQQQHGQQKEGHQQKSGESHNK